MFRFKNQIARISKFISPCLSVGRSINCHTAPSLGLSELNMDEMLLALASEYLNHLHLCRACSFTLLFRFEKLDIYYFAEYPIQYLDRGLWHIRTITYQTIPVLGDSHHQNVFTYLESRHLVARNRLGKVSMPIDV